MDALPYEAQTALVSLVAALLIGGSVSVFGFANVAGAARFAIQFAMRRRIVTGVGLSALAGLGAFIANQFGWAGDGEAAGVVFGLLG